MLEYVWGEIFVSTQSNLNDALHPLQVGAMLPYNHDWNFPKTVATLNNLCINPDCQAIEL